MPSERPPDEPRRGRYARRALAVAAVMCLAGLSIAGALRTSDDPIVERAEPTPARPALPPPVAVEPQAPDERPRVAGWIIDSSGLPIEGAVISVRTRDGALRQEVARTDVAGAFRLRSLPRAGDTLVVDGPAVFPSELSWQSTDGPARIMVPRRVSITARVAIDGAPVAGAEVHLSDGSAPVLEIAFTDLYGVARFSDLRPGAYELWARRGATVSPLGRTMRAGPGPHDPVELALEPGATVRGRAVADGTLPDEAAVVLVPQNVDHSVRRAPVDVDGRFEVEGLPHGRWAVEAEATGFVRATDYVVDVVGERADITVRLRRAGGVTGTVIDATGAPVAGATLVLRGEGPGQVASHADPLPVERQRRSLPSRRVRWVHPLAGHRQMPVRDARRFGAVRPGLHRAECGRGHCGVDIGVERGSVVHAAADGEVALVIRRDRDETGRYVILEHPSGLRTFYMHLDDVRADLEVGRTVRAGQAIGTLGRTGIEHSGPHLHFAISQERRGRTWYIDPEPILRHAVVRSRPAALEQDRPVDAALVASAPRVELGGPILQFDPPAPERFTTGEDGRFRIDEVSPGSYVASAFHTELAPGMSESFRVRTGEQIDGVRIMLSPGVVVQGRVVGNAGAIGGARVEAREGSGQAAHRVARAYTDADGRFELRPLAGDVTLSVSAIGHGDARRSVSLQPPALYQTQRTVDFELVAEDARLSGQVLDPGGFPAPGVTVRIVDGPTDDRSATTGPHGHFTLEALAAGAYVVAVDSPDYPRERARMQTGERAKIALRRGGELDLDVRDAHTGAPLSGVRLRVSGPKGRRERLLTGSRGSATLRAMAPGRWKVRVHHEGFVPIERTYQVAPGPAGRPQRIELARGATLAGTVRDQYGRRVAGARVWLGESSTRTDQNGDFRLTDVPTGAVTLKARRDAARGAVSLGLAPGDEFVTMQINLGPAAE